MVELGLAAVGWILVPGWISGARGFDLNALLFLTLLLGLALHGRPERLAAACAAGAVALGEVGLPVAWCYQVLTFLNAGAVNLLVPSGGGQWALQGPVVLAGAQEPAVGLPVGRAVVAFAHGDAWTNLLQPFWALALLSVTRVQARDILGYTMAVLVLIVPLYLLAFAV